MKPTEAHTEDQALVRRCQEGDQSAFRLLVERYQKKAFAHALGMVRDRDEAMDIAQEAFVKVFNYLDSFRGGSSFYTWLHRIVSNLCVDRIRRKSSVPIDENRAQASDQGSEELDAPGGSLASLEADPLRAVLRSELAGKIDEALAQIPEKHREILLLRELEGMSYEDMARVLKVPKGTVMSRLYHARTKLQELLGDYVGWNSKAQAVGD